MMILKVEFTIILDLVIMPLMSESRKREDLSVDDYVRGVRSDSRTILARTITLIESNSPEHYKKAQSVLKMLYPYSGNSLRVGITGMPGSGKSTLIETLGCDLIEQGFKVAVLTVDPSSVLTRGSILGDKTRMEKLSRRKGCFIRPSPSGGTLGGVTRKSRETILVCEAAGFDIILIETVGVGQNEITVRSMVDFFLLLLIPGAGDELQGIKRGVMEIADALLINKAEGDHKQRALQTKHEYELALKHLAPATRGWNTPVYTCSAQTGEGVSNIWDAINRFQQITRKNGMFDERRKNQNLDWVFALIDHYLKDNFFSHEEVQKALAKIKEDVLSDSILPTAAADQLLNLFFHQKK
ncbi:MAG: methylmalonyl Co-A mutase-associated GTPase MeaB [Candidatus Aminicenantes bacterium]|nr:methylmalonyl Co-A mutase-associated GTPase MeaB [Candidatus Aminicenantes bacterium]